MIRNRMFRQFPSDRFIKVEFDTLITDKPLAQKVIPTADLHRNIDSSNIDPLDLYYIYSLLDLSPLPSSWISIWRKIVQIPLFLS